MSKPFTEDDLATQLTQDRTWRIKELSDLKTAVKDADKIGQSVLLRALVTIAYAHWEGHVRFSARRYLQHIALRKLTFSTLTLQFTRSYFLPRLAAMATKSITERGNLIDEILSAPEGRFTRVNEALVNTKSNLNFETFADICVICGVDPQAFASKAGFVDVILLKRRNGIAHGEDTLVGVSELDDITDETVALMRHFSDELQNNAYLRSYLAA